MDAYSQTEAMTHDLVKNHDQTVQTLDWAIVAFYWYEQILDHGLSTRIAWSLDQGRVVTRPKTQSERHPETSV